MIFYTHHTSHTPAKRGKEASFLRKIGGSLHPFRVHRKRNEHKALITSQILNNHSAEASPQGLIPQDHRGFPSRSGGTGPFLSTLLPSRHATKKPMRCASAFIFLESSYYIALTFFWSLDFRLAALFLWITERLASLSMMETILGSLSVFRWNGFFFLQSCDVP